MRLKKKRAKASVAAACGNEVGKGEILVAWKYFHSFSLLLLLVYDGLKKAETIVVEEARKGKTW